MGLRYAIDRLRIRRKYPDLARLHDQTVDVGRIVAKLADFETVKSLRALIPAHVQYAYVFSTAPLGAEMAEISEISGVEDAPGYVLGYGYLGARLLLGHEVQHRPTDDLSILTQLREAIEEIANADMGGGGGRSCVSLMSATSDALLDGRRIDPSHEAILWVHSSIAQDLAALEACFTHS